MGEGSTEEAVLVCRFYQMYPRGNGTGFCSIKGDMKERVWGSQICDSNCSGYKAGKSLQPSLYNPKDRVSRSDSGFDDERSSLRRRKSETGTTGRSLSDIIQEVAQSAGEDGDERSGRKRRPGSNSGVSPNHRREAVSPEAATTPDSSGGIDGEDVRGTRTAERGWEWDKPIGQRYRDKLAKKGIYVPDDQLLTLRMFLLSRDPRNGRCPHIGKVADVLGISDKSVKNAKSVGKKRVADAGARGVDVSELDVEPDRSSRGVPWLEPIGPQLRDGIISTGLPEPDEGETLKQYIVSEKRPGVYKLSHVLGVTPQTVVDARDRALKALRKGRGQCADEPRDPKSAVSLCFKGTPRGRYRVVLWDAVLTDAQMQLLVGEGLPTVQTGRTLRSYLVQQEVSAVKLMKVLDIDDSTLYRALGIGRRNLAKHGQVSPGVPEPEGVMEEALV